MDHPTGSTPFAKGSVILQEKTYDPSAYLILSGSVEVSREEAGRRVVVARLGPGEIVGEMGLILDRPRTATVRALEDTVCERVDSETFGKLLASNPEKVVPFIRMLFERYRTADAYMKHSPGVVVRSGAPESRNPSLEPATPEARASLNGQDGLRIEKFPFRMGRKQNSLFADVTAMNDLLLIDQPPFQISRNHCSINRLPDGGFFVVDRGSSLGTVVNGIRIGIAGETNEAPLDRDVNELVLGLPSSPFRFEIDFSL